MRVRQFTQDDAHIFCAPEQVVAEVKNFVLLLKEVYSDFGFNDVVVGLSTRPALRAGSDEDWDKAEHDLAEAVKAAGLSYVEQPGEGAFYGPKLEFALKDLKGRQWQCGTIQLDMVLPKRLDAKYAAADGSLQQPVMLHRAILGSFERFIGILLENYDGNLPFWLSPENVVVIPMKGAEKAAESFADMAKRQGARVIYDDSDENLKQKIKVHSEMKRNWIVVIGNRDVEKGVVSVRKLGASHPQEIVAGLALTEIQSLIK
jgi:threonyl-tRNA synthetase